MFFTTNKTTTEAVNIAPDEIISSLEIATWAGQESEPVSFRIGCEDPYGEAFNLTSNDPNIFLSLNSRRGYSNGVTLTVESGAVSDSVFVKARADLSVVEGDNQARIFVNGGEASLQVNYFFAEADQGDTATPPAIRFLGQETVNMQEQFELYGETVRLRRYEPLPNPRCLSGNPFKLSEIDNLSPEEQCNPHNNIVGYTHEDFYSKAFIGGRNLDVNTVFDRDTPLVYTDVERVVLPPGFVGFDPSYITTEEFFGEIGPSQPAYQRTQWTILRHDGEYSLTNIQRQHYYNGQFLYYFCELVRVVYPMGYQDSGFLPWNQLYQKREDGGQVIGYVSGYSQIVTEDPYLAIGGSS